MTTTPDMPLFSAAHQSEQVERIFRVREINQLIRNHLEKNWSSLSVEAELSDVHRSAAGHFYFTLNDEEEQAQLRGVLFRGDARRCRITLKDGIRVRVRGGLSLFESRGQFQFIAREIHDVGAGDLAAKFEAIRKKLAAEGLMDEERKRELPRFPRTIGVVTSLSGAALQDILRVSSERSLLRIVVADCRVQGEDAVTTIVEALRNIQRLEELDVVIVSRGGGSAEDLWAFNEEAVARAISTCRVPVVTGIGHEIDLTISDLVADLRAATPSNAAEIVVPDREALELEIDVMTRRLTRAMEISIDRRRLRLERAQRRLREPRTSLLSIRRDLEQLRARLWMLPQQLIGARDRSLQLLNQRLYRREPLHVLKEQRLELDHMRSRMLHSLKNSLASHHASIDAQAARLEALSPTRVLERGYAIVTHTENHKAVRSTREVESNDLLNVQVSDGSFGARVENQK